MRRLVFTAFLLVIAMSGGWLLGQQQTPTQQSPAIPPNLIVGPDIGFRMEESVRGRYYGTLMVRTRSGEWVEVTPKGQGGVVPLETR